MNAKKKPDPAAMNGPDTASMSDNEIVDYLSKQLKVDKYDSKKYTFDATMKSVLNAEQAQEFRVVPLQKKGSLLLIATTDPADIYTIDEVQRVTKMDVEPVICTDTQLNQLAQQMYGTTFNLKEMMSSLDGVDAETESDEEGKDKEYSIGTMQDMAQEAPVIRMVNSLLVQAAREKASDVHISPEADRIQLRLRIDGELQEIPAPPKAFFMALSSRIKLISNMDISVTRIPQDGRFSFRAGSDEISVRASALPTVYGENIVLRLLRQGTQSLELDQLGFREEEQDKFERAVKKPYGMVLATGPTGSGKSTLLYALIRRINKPNVNIITLEDPVEYRMGGIRQVQLNRKAGMTFSSGLRSILRQDPNVIMVGEIRDNETASIAVESALTGHLVLSTLHTNTAAGAVTRFTEMGIEPFLVASTLLVAGAQRLVRRICPNCIEPYEAPLEAMEALGLKPVKGTLFLRGKGCYACNQTGYSGRVGIYEILEVTDILKDAIIKGKSTHELERVAVDEGTLRTLIMDAADKVLRGFTTLEEAGAAVLV